MEKLYSVTLVLENCEWYEFYAKDAELRIDDIKFVHSSISTHLEAEYVRICINKHSCPFNQDAYNNEQWHTRIDRDIAQIHLKFQSGKTYTIMTPWNIRDSYENSWQTDRYLANTESLEYIIMEQAD